MLKSILTAVLLVGLPLLASAASLDEAVSATHHAAADAADHVKDVAHAAEHSEGLKPFAAKFHIGPLAFTNSMVVTWIVALGLILFAQMATRNVQLVPGGLQNFCEWLVESLYDFLGSVLGPQLIKKSFWFFATLFIFILFTNWFGLIPGVGTIGQNVTMSDGSHAFKPFLRGGNADLNMTLAMSLTFFFLWTFWAFQSLGVAGFFKHIFGGGGDTKGFAAIAMMGIFFFVGVIEVISIAFRPVSLSFRLYGNIFAGENILEAMMHLGGTWFGCILPLPFYFLELLVGLVQALVFTLLTSVFTALMCAHPEHAHEEAHEHGHAHAKH